MPFAPTLSQGDLERISTELLSNWLILEPELPPEILADRIVSDADPVFRGEFGRTLMIAFFARQIRAERAKQRLSALQKPEGFTHLPSWIGVRKDGRSRRIRLDKVTYTSALIY